MALMISGSIPDIMSVPDAVPDAIALFTHLGYPAYLLPFLGIAKLLGVVALLIPGFSLQYLKAAEGTIGSLAALTGG
ncbi:MAG: DoxX-like family protein [Bacilli bacterium]|nr:DoxX-like family protein [Bacilli bacterium]